GGGVWAGGGAWGAGGWPPGGGGPRTAAVLGASAGQLLVPRLLGDGGPLSWTFLPLSGVPVACQAGAAAVLLLRLGRHRPLAPAHAATLFAFLGMASFALAVALGFLIHQSGDVHLALGRLAVVLALGGIPPVGRGPLGPARPARRAAPDPPA